MRISRSALRGFGWGLSAFSLSSLVPYQVGRAEAAPKKAAASPTTKASASGSAKKESPAKVEAPAEAELEDPAADSDGADDVEPPQAEPDEDSASSDSTPPASSAASAACAGPSPNKTHTLWVDGGFRWDSGNSSRSEQVGGNRDSSNTEVNALGPMFHVGLLFRQNQNVAMGGVFGYGASHDLNNDDLLIGQLLTLEYVADFSAPLSDKFSIVGAPRGGLSLIIPGGVLEERIDTNQQAGYDTWSGPRYGFLLGFEAGVRYKLAPWLHLRAMVGYSWNMLFLLDSKAEGSTVSASQSWQVQASRLGANLGFEASF